MEYNDTTCYQVAIKMVIELWKVKTVAAPPLEALISLDSKASAPAKDPATSSSASSKQLLHLPHLSIRHLLH